MALKIDKNEQEARKLWPPEVGGGSFYTTSLNATAHSHFLILSKNP